ncbi:hypothetical protein NUM3379_11900 [Kineococcus sp. NUM-3379]
MALTCAPLLAVLLLHGQHRADPADVLRSLDAPACEVPVAERPLVRAAAALLAGEPKAARDALADLPGGTGPAVARALAVAADVLEHNWFPPDTGADPLEAGWVPLPAPEPPADPAERLVVLLAAGLLPTLLSARAVLDHASSIVRAGGPEPREAVAAVLESSAAAGRALSGLGAVPGAAQAVAHHAACHADLLSRAGRREEAAAALGRLEAGADRWLRAQCLLLRGDHAARAPGGATDAVGHWRAAAATAGTASAAAVCRLREAALEEDTGTGAAAEAARLAERAGAGALHAHASVLLVLRGAHETVLCGAHGTVARGADGSAGGAPAVADALVRWARGPGSTAFARGLCRVLAEAAARLRGTGALDAARRALLLADELARGVGAGPEQRLVREALAGFFAGGTYPLLTALRSLGLAAERLAGPGPLDLDDVPAVGELATAAVSAAHRRRDPELLQACESVLRGAAAALRGWAAAPGQDLGGAAGMLAQVVVPLEHAADALPVFVRWYRGVEAWRAGLEEGRRDLELVLAEPGAGAALARVGALLALGRAEEARAEAAGAAGTLPAGAALALALQVRDTGAALRAWDRLGGALPPDEGQPWEAPALHAALVLALGVPGEAAELAGRATASFETWQARLGRDVVRTEAADDPLVAGAYLTEVVAWCVLAEDAAAAGDGARAATALARALAAADAARAGLLHLAEEVVRAESDPAARRALGGWLAAGAAWAAAVERAGREVVAGLGRAAQAGMQGGARAGTRGDPRAAVDAAEEVLAAAEDALRRAAPGVLRDEPRPRLDVERVRAHLPAGALLLLPHAYDDELVVFAVTGDGVRHWRRPVPTAELSRAVLTARRTLSRPSADQAQEVLRRLAEVLLEPAAAELDATGALAVVPHGVLGQLPWHLLPRAGARLVDERPVSLLPSAGLLTVPGATAPPRLDGGALVVGDPAYADLARLPGTGVEARAVAALLGCADPLLGPDATAARVRALAPGRRVWHLATHGLLDERAPHLSRLALAGDDALGLGEVVELGLDADLVVLAACRSGQGRATAGGDVVGVARAALAAGARHVVVSLWPVDDLAGCLVMTGLYERLAAGVPVAAALRGAALAVRDLDDAGRTAAYEELRARRGGPRAAPGARDADPLVPPGGGGGADHPYSWAPFVHLGAPA